MRIDDVNGQPFDAEATYAVVTSNANFNGMDSSYVLKAAAEANEQSAVTTAVVRDVVFRFIAAELNHQAGTADDSVSRPRIGLALSFKRHVQNRMQILASPSVRGELATLCTRFSEREHP